MKKIFMCLLIISVTALSGCRDATELGNRGVVQALAVDYRGKYMASVLVFSGGGAAGDTIDPTMENVIKVTGEGETLSEAIDNISLSDGKKMYMRETKLLILGGGFEAVKASDLLKTLYYDMRCSLNMPVCCAENSELLTDLHFSEGITSAEKPLLMIENAYEKGVCPKTTLLDLLSAEELGKECLVPLFKPAQNGYGMTSSEEGETAELCGTRVFRRGSLGAILDRSETAGRLLIEGKISKLPLNFYTGDKESTCLAYEIKVKQQGKDRKITAKFKGRNGGVISDKEKIAAMEKLTEIVRKSINTS